MAKVHVCQDLAFTSVTSLTLTLHVHVASAGGRGSPPRTPTATPRARSQPPWRAMEAPFGGTVRVRKKALLVKKPFLF